DGRGPAEAPGHGGRRRAGQSRTHRGWCTVTDGFLFTSESVTEGHPDKVADQISDAVVDAALAADPASRVAVETLLTTGLVVLAGGSTPRAGAGLRARPRRGACGGG